MRANPVETLQSFRKIKEATAFLFLNLKKEKLLLKRKEQEWVEELVLLEKEKLKRRS